MAELELEPIRCLYFQVCSHVIEKGVCSISSHIPYLRLIFCCLEFHRLALWPLKTGLSDYSTLASVHFPFCSINLSRPSFVRGKGRDKGISWELQRLMHWKWKCFTESRYPYKSYHDLRKYTIQGPSMAKCPCIANQGANNWFCNSVLSQVNFYSSHASCLPIKLDIYL